jgi:hypothetical protein
LINNQSLSALMQVAILKSAIAQCYSRSRPSFFYQSHHKHVPDDIHPATPSLACRAAGRCCATTETSLTLLSFISLIILECIFEQNDIKTHSELIPDNAPSLAFLGKSFRQAQLRC